MRRTAFLTTTAAAAGLVAVACAGTLPQTHFSLSRSRNPLEDTCLSCSTAPTCPLDPCSTNTPGGLLLLTQFWDFAPAIGPADSWTIHGLWPDTCNGSYDADCDPARNNNNIAAVLRASSDPKAASTLDAMNQFWLALNGNDAQLWSHEWSKHGTCISTLNPTCYAGTRAYEKNEDIVDFFSTTVDLFAQYNVFQALQDAGITPSSTQRYTLDQLKQATRAKWGKEATFKCRNGALNEAWIYFHTSGRSTSADAFVQTDPLTSNNRCPSYGIRYVPK
ncbi:related to ribonuclease M [Sporisorium reilianum f. sp. reilianum]|uniref:ribonuclease T2 n=1 Tax=Sporisorium reilianum f. sp. reilianum TaxID=72559 RepID=A0A2N8UDE7_9BASI|nr:related to ribonuclease M [Sporisorium reilianum f. sp. reilianum]